MENKQSLLHSNINCEKFKKKDLLKLRQLSDKPVQLEPHEIETMGLNKIYCKKCEKVVKIIRGFTDLEVDLKNYKIRPMLNGRCSICNTFLQKYMKKFIRFGDEN
jgi:hypothetical protein